MEQTALQSFISEKVRDGRKKAYIKEQLMAVGWSEEEADTAYAQALVALGVPVPSAGPGAGYGAKKSSTFEVMINFFSFILLGVIATALGTLYFQVIGKYFPDSLMVGDYGYNSGISSDSVHYAIAALIIACPIFYFSIRMWFQRFREDEGKMESRLTKWVTYLVLLATSMTLVGDLIAVLYTFLQGEMSTRFFLKALTILVIAGMIFGFYFLERRKIQYRQDITRSTFQLFGWGFLVVVLVGIVLGFFAAGSPSTERMRTFDERRSSDLSSLASCISGYSNEYGRLPQSLEDLSKSSQYSYCPSTVDPDTGLAYEYRIVTASQTVGKNREGEYELCATFSMASDATMRTRSGYMYGSNNGVWDEHTAGRFCAVQRVILETISSVSNSGSTGWTLPNTGDASQGF